MHLGWKSVIEGTTIRTRLTVVLVVLLLLWGAVSAVMLFELTHIHARAERVVVEHLPRLKRANDLEDLANHTARLMGEMQLVSDRAHARARVERILGIRARARGDALVRSEHAAR